MLWTKSATRKPEVKLPLQRCNRPLDHAFQGYPQHRALCVDHWPDAKQSQSGPHKANKDILSRRPAFYLAFCPEAKQQNCTRCSMWERFSLSNMCSLYDCNRCSMCRLSGMQYTHEILSLHADTSPFLGAKAVHLMQVSRLRCPINCAHRNCFCIATMCAVSHWDEPALDQPDWVDVGHKIPHLLVATSCPCLSVVVGGALQVLAPTVVLAILDAAIQVTISLAILFLQLLATYFPSTPRMLNAAL